MRCYVLLNQIWKIFVKCESWKYCEKYNIVEPNKMLPTCGHQKLTPLTNCICTKGRCFVPMVCLNISWFFFLRTLSVTSLFLNLFQ